MPPEDQTMLNPPGLSVIERRQVRDRRRLSFVQDPLGHRLKRGPARPVEGRGSGDLSQQTPPFDDDPIDVAGAEEFRDPSALVRRTLVNAGDDLFRSTSITGRHAVLQVTRDGLKPKVLMTD